MPVEVAEAGVTEVNFGWIADNLYPKPLLLGQVEPKGKQCTGVMGSDTEPNPRSRVLPEFFSERLLRI